LRGWAAGGQLDMDTTLSAVQVEELGPCLSKAIPPFLI
jgi:hypothetical protein